MAVVQCLVHEAARISRNRPVFLGSDIRICYGEWDLMVSATALLLRNAGVTPGARVALYMEPGWAYATLLFALIRIGAVACPLSTRWPVQAVREQLRHIDARILIARISEPSRAVLGEELTALDPDGMVSREVTSGQQEDHFSIDLAQPATILSTSGSTGTPKAILHTYGNHYYSAHGANLNARLKSEDCWLLSLPLYHVGGLGILFRCVFSGAAVGLMNRGQSWASALSEFPVTHLSLVPTQLHRLLEEDIPTEALQRLKAIILGGSTVPASLVDKALARGLPVCPSYGLSEMTSQVTACGPVTPFAKRSTAGRALRYREVRTAPDGEIQVRGATRSPGYIQQEQVQLPVDDDGWFATGDIGHVDEEGYLTVTGRKDYMFISGGENIQPEEIEQALLAVPGVQQAAVVPVPDGEFGERPVAFLERDPACDEESIRVALRTVLPSYKIPDAFRPWPEDWATTAPDRKWSRAELIRRVQQGTA